MKILHFVIIVIAIAGVIGPALLLFAEMTTTSQATLASRFSQSFFSIFTLIPIGVIALGSVILFIAVKERKIRTRQVIYLMTLIGSVIVFLGFGIFSLSMMD